LKYKVYLSDEGYGHLVRQRAIFEELMVMQGGISATVQTSACVDAAKKVFHNAEFINKFNNIAWQKLADGSPDLEKIKLQFEGYIDRSERFISNEQDLSDFDFVLSDFVYEAFAVAQNAGVPVFGVAHFTWDWFFSKMYPIPVSMDVLDRMSTHAKKASAIFFPPFTPQEILKEYKSIARKVPLIVNKIDVRPLQAPRDCFTVMIMDSGANVLRNHIESAISQIKQIKDVHFLMAEKYNVEGENVTKIPATEFLSDYIPSVDLVITRGGFNTISECIAHRVPILLLGEPMNPEIERNLLYIKEEELGSFISLKNFVGAFADVLNRFIDNEYKNIKTRMDEHELETNGAEVVAAEILQRVG
jgi:uncharacterized protein (TIGR00661 family)